MSVSSRGFTLLELMVVLAIAAVILAMALPVGGKRSGRELERAARDVAASLRVARERAILTNEGATLTVDLEHGFYQADGTGRPAAFPRGTEVRLATTADEQEGRRIGHIRFYPDGSASGGGVLLSRDGEHRAVLVDWLTGAVEVHNDTGKR